MELETKRLLLRPVVADDYNDFFEYAKNPRVGPAAGWKPHANREETLRVMRDEFLGREHVFGIVLKETGRMIGSLGLIEDRKRNFSQAKMLGYAIGEPYWGQGITAEAVKALLQYGFETQDIAIVSAYCFPTNFSSRRVLEKCGFRYEGMMRMVERLYDGKIYDNLCFSLKKEEFEGKE